MIVIPVRCLRCGGWTLRSPRQLRTPRRHAPRWMRNAPALVMAGGVQIGPSGVTIGSGGVIVTDADGTPCCCSGSSSSSGSFSSSSGSASIGSGSGSSGSGSGGGICPTDCSSCPNTLSATWTLDVSSISLHCTSTGTITRGRGRIAIGPARGPVRLRAALCFLFPLVARMPWDAAGDLPHTRAAMVALLIHAADISSEVAHRARCLVRRATKHFRLRFRK
jgi:hypothetical protein